MSLTKIRSRSILAYLVAAGLAGSAPATHAQDTAATARPATAGKKRSRQHADSVSKHGDSASAKHKKKSTGGKRADGSPPGSGLIPDSADAAKFWPVRNAPTPLPGAILPARRIVAYYGNPLSKKMGILGELPPDQMLARLDQVVAESLIGAEELPVVFVRQWPFRGPLLAIPSEILAVGEGKHRVGQLGLCKHQ